MNLTHNNNIKSTPLTQRALTQMALITVQLPCRVMNDRMKCLRVLWGGARDVPPAQSAIVDADQNLQETLQSLYSTPVTVRPSTTVDAPMTPYYVPVDFNGDTATVCQSDLDDLGEFINMRKTQNDWHLAFLTLYPPVLKNGVWSYYGQPNTNRATQDRSTTSCPIWHKWNMWRSGGRLAKHPTLTFVLANEQYKHQLFGQRRVCLDTESTVYVSMSPASFMESMRGPASSGNTF
jgi:hypothetical protein